MTSPSYGSKRPLDLGNQPSMEKNRSHSRKIIIGSYPMHEGDHEDDGDDGDDRDMSGMIQVCSSDCHRSAWNDT